MKNNYCELHPSSKLTLFCETDDKFICTKCLIKNRDIHYDHVIHEISEMYDDASNDLNLNRSQNEKEKINIQNQM